MRIHRPMSLKENRWPAFMPLIPVVRLALRNQSSEELERRVNATLEGRRALMGMLALLLELMEAAADVLQEET